MREALKVTKALADETRLRILKILELRPFCVGELTIILQRAQSTVSKHLAILKDAGLIEDCRDGLWVNYQLCKSSFNPHALEALRMINSWLNDEPQTQQDKDRGNTVKKEDFNGNQR
jgi:ArsR family transcriptional regulator, arsenate/arsenite/antimonite-responsive transcriptional repressor